MPRWAIALAVLTGCGESPPLDARDAGSDSGPGFVPSTPVPPAPPAPPALPDWPCPDGWRVVAEPAAPGLSTCDPWPEGGPLDCAIDEAHFPGGDGCERIGPACPVGEFADGLPASGVWYARAGAAAGGDGSIGDPFGTIADAIGVASDGDVVALSKGTFDEVVVIDRPIVLRGACVAETLVASSIASDTEGTLGVVSGGTVVRDLRVSGARFGATVGEDPDPVTFESVVIEGATGVGLIVRRGGLLRASHLVVRDVGPLGGRYGYGIETLGGARLEVDRLAVERTSTLGILVSDAGSALDVSDAAVRDVAENPADGTGGYGIDAGAGTTLEGARIAVERTRTAAVAARPDSTVTLSDAVLRDVQERAIDAIEGTGLSVSTGAHAEVSRALLSRAASAGVWALGGELLLSDVVVADTVGLPPPGFAGYGVTIERGASADLVRVALVRDRSVALRVFFEDTEVRASDLVVADTLAAPSTGTGGIGAATLDGGHLQIDRATFERSRLAGLYADGPGSELVVRDVVVRDTLAQESDGAWGLGVQVTTFAHADLSRLEVEHAREMALALGADVVATDVTIRDTEEGPTGWGIGIYVGAPGAATLSRVAVERSRISGVLVSGSNASAVLEDLRVTDSLEASCVLDGCAAGGRGLTASADALIGATRFVVTRTALCGLQLVDGGTIDLSDGEVSENPVAANVQTENFDVDRLRDRVLFRDNDELLDGSALPVPETRLLP